MEKISIITFVQSSCEGCPFLDIRHDDGYNCVHPDQKAEKVDGFHIQIIQYKMAKMLLKKWKYGSASEVRDQQKPVLTEEWFMRNNCPGILKNIKQCVK